MSVLTHTIPGPPTAAVVAAAVAARFAGVGVAFAWRVRFPAGEAAGVGEVAGVAFALRLGFAVGEGEAVASAAGDAASVASAFEGDAVGVGD